MPRFPETWSPYNWAPDWEDVTPPDIQVEHHENNNPVGFARPTHRPVPPVITFHLDADGHVVPTVVPGLS